MQQMRRAWFIAFNNLRLFFLDRLAVGMFILFPFLFIVMFNILLADTGQGDNRITLYLTTQETAGISLNLIESMETRDESTLAPGQPVIVWIKDYNQARKNVEQGKIGGFLSFPANFTQNVMGGRPTNLEIVARAESTGTQAALNGIAEEIGSSISAGAVEIKAVSDLLSRSGSSLREIRDAVASIIERHSSPSSHQSLISYEVTNVGEVRPVMSSSFVVPGYLVMFVFFLAAVSSVDIIRERQNHTLERLLASSARKETILGGIFMGMVFRGLVQIAIFWTIGILAFNINLGIAPWMTVLISLLMVIVSAAFSLMLATTARTERSAGAIATLVALLLAPLGGCWWPLFITPHWMQFLAKFTPHGWATDAFNKLMLFGAGPGDVTWSLVALAGFAVAFISVAIIKFRTSADAI